MSPRGW
jgi:hypothetical protein